MIGIYKITSPKGRIYIGQSIDVKRRFSQYRRMDSTVKTSPKLYRSLCKYGYKNHKFEVICECLESELNEKERYYQEKYNANSNFNLNCILTETDTKRRKCKPLTKEHKKQISKVHKGKKLSKITIQKIKEARSKQIITDEHKRNISLNSGSARLVLDMSNGFFYNSAKEASDAYGYKHNWLICRLIGRTKNNTNLTYV